MTRTRIIAAGTLVVAAAALPAFGSATAGPSGTMHLVLREDKANTKQLDLGRKGDSAGDEILLSSTARAHGKVVGRTEAVCVLQDLRYFGFSCDGSLMLSGGVITFEGSALGKKLPDVGRTSLPGGEHYAITGGTGAYRGASGEVRLHGPEKAERADIRFS
jgi:hypothetical protein